VGEFAAVATSVFWTLSAVIFTLAGRRVGALVLNRVRLGLAVIFLGVSHLILQGTLIPLDAGAERWFWLGLSGFVGLTLGDLALFQAYLSIGPRLGTLIMATVPVFSTLLAWLFLGETTSLGKNAGIGLAVSGIALVVLQRQEQAGKTAPDRRDNSRGLLFGFLAAAGQTTGLILTKRGLVGGYSALSGVLIRMIVAAAIMWLVTIGARQVRETFATLREPRTLALIIAGSLVGPFAGIWFSTIAIQQASVGVASTLMSLNPIFILPFSGWVFKERISSQAILGTFITILGVALIFLL
jgi:drug/metabolite transporter (DMT)-like permease